MQHCFFTIILISVCLGSCNNIHTVRPPCIEQSFVISTDTSFLSTPLVIPAQLIEDKLNHAIQQNILNDQDFENRNKKGRRDKLKLKVQRLGDIKVSWKNNVATYQAPLLVLIEQEIVRKNILPLSKSLALKTEFSLRLVVETTVDIGADWKLNPKTKFISFEWLSDVKTLGGLIDIKKIVERRMHRRMPEVLATLDGTIRNSVHLDRVIGRVWRNIQKPIKINRKEQLIWLKINPIQFEMGTISTDSGNLLIQGRLSATTETLLGDNPVYTIDSVLPPLVKRASLPDSTYFYLISEISYTDINEVVGRKLVGKEFTISGHTLKVKSAEISGCVPDLVLHIRVEGDVAGDIYFQGTPRFEQDSQTIIIENFDFEVKTEEALLASADWLMHSTFKEQMKDALSLPLAEKIVKIPDLIMEGIEGGRMGKKMDFTIEKWDFRPQKIWIRPSDIATLIIVNARVRVELEQL